MKACFAILLPGVYAVCSGGGRWKADVDECTACVQDRTWGGESCFWCEDEPNNCKARGDSTCNGASAYSQDRCQVMYSPCSKCKEWYTKDLAAGREWLDRLPNCPCTQSQIDADELFSRSDHFIHTYHPGADHCYRSAGQDETFADGSTGKTAQQCCYVGGKLITSGFGAGTPDRAAASYVSLNHKIIDVDSHANCCQKECDAAGMTCKQFCGLYYLSLIHI